MGGTYWDLTYLSKSYLRVASPWTRLHESTWRVVARECFWSKLQKSSFSSTSCATVPKSKFVVHFKHTFARKSWTVWLENCREVIWPPGSKIFCVIDQPYDRGNPSNSKQSHSTPLFHGRSITICKGIARTQSPTIKNYALELPTFGVIVGVSLTGVQWKGLTLEEPPSWSWLTSAPGKYAYCFHPLWPMNPDPEDQLKQDKDMLSGGGSYTFTFYL